MSWAKRYALRNIAFSVSRSATTYGTGNYGDGTYGSEATDALVNVDFVLSADPGEWPSGAGWVFRRGDIGAEFVAIALGQDGLMDLSPVERAVLVLERASTGDEVIIARELTVDGNRLRCTFQDGDLDTQGVYRAVVQLVFESGRAMSLTPDDASTFIIRGGGR